MVTSSERTVTQGLAGARDDSITTGSSFLKRWGTMVALAIPGLAALGLTAAGQLGSLPGLPTLPTPVLVLLTLVQPTLLVLAAAAVGVALAPRLGLRSHALAWAAKEKRPFEGFRAELPTAVGLGLFVFALVVAIDVLTRPFVAAPTGSVTAAPTVGAVVGSLPVRLLYGGVVEELLLRFGLLTLVAWVLWRLVQRDGGVPSTAIVWSAIVLSALAFGAGHLPAAATLGPLSTAMIARVVSLNALAGLALGWLYWRKSLEASMVAHATFHVALVGLNVALLLLS